MVKRIREEDLDMFSKQRSKFSYHDLRRRIIYMFLWLNYLKDNNEIKPKDVADLLQSLDGKDR